MNNRNVITDMGIIVLMLAALAVRVQSSPVAMAQAGQNGVSGSLAGSDIYIPLILVDGSEGDEDGEDRNDAGLLWLPYTLGDGSILPTYGASVAVDSRDGVHVVYAIYTGTNELGQQPATYAYCTAQCGDKANWSFTHIGEAVLDARIALDPAGKPRLMLFGPVDDLIWPRVRYQYATCGSGCTNSANWTLTTIATPIESTATREYNNNHYFALDKQGRPAFIYTDTIQNNHPGTFYMSCQINCSDANQWTETALTTGAPFDKVSLAFSPNGQPRLAFGFNDADDDLYLSFAQCDANCIDGANWSGTTLVQIHGSTKFNLAVDSNGRPRLGVYTGSYAYAPFQPQKLLYLWCDTACAAVQNWSFDDTGLPFGTGDGVDLVLDGLNRPRMSFETSAQGLGLAWCNTNCESDGAGWQSQEVESQASLADNYEVLPIRRCTVSTWFNGQRSSLALDSTGNPRIAYDAQHWWYGTEIVDGVPKPCNYQDVTVTRMAVIDQP
jgi:hypothetical protein